MATLPTRTLGRNGPSVTAMGFGLMGLSAFYGTIESDEERFKVLDRAYELGQRFWDSADVYGDSEDMLGRYFERSGRRDDIFLSTKFGLGAGPERSVRSDPEYVRAACEKSLRRLKVASIDLYYCHRLDRVTPVEKTVEAMVALKNEGKIRYIGLSEVSSASLRRAYAVHPITAVQIEYSPFTLDIEMPDIKLLQTCRELGVAVVAYSPLGRGFLTGAIRSPDDFAADDFRRVSPRFSPANFGKNLKLVDELASLAKAKGCTSSQLVLAWLMAQGDDIFPIPGTKKIKYLEENLGAFKVHLSPQEVQHIRTAVEAAEIVGDRYPPALMQVVFADTPPLT